MAHIKRLLATLFILCGIGTLSFAQKENAQWAKIAEGMSQALIDNFWGASFECSPNRYYFNYKSNLADLTTDHYWPQAHAMDVVVDAYLRTGDKKYKSIYPLWWKGAPAHNFANKLNPKDPWWNVYVDDMEWMTLTLIRMWESTGKKIYIEKARQMYDEWIWTTWGPEDEAPWYGGITWKTDIEKSKNACSNGPAALIAARLCRFYNQAKLKGGKCKEAYLSEAVKIYSWEKSVLFDKKTGAVYDNINKQGEIKRNWVFTYSIGTFLGAAHELYLITGDRQYLEDAILAANYAVDKMSNNRGVLDDAPNGDGGLFHGIFFRYFVKLINEENVAKNTRIKFHKYLTRLAETMLENGINHGTMLYGGRWWKAPADKEVVSLTPHLSGCMLMEAMAILKPIK